MSNLLIQNCKIFKRLPEKGCATPFNEPFVVWQISNPNVNCSAEENGSYFALRNVFNCQLWFSSSPQKLKKLLLGPHKQQTMSQNLAPNFCRAQQLDLLFTNWAIIKLSILECAFFENLTHIACFREKQQVSPAGCLLPRDQVVIF